MKKRLAGAIQIALLLIIMNGLAIGCEGLSSVPSPPISEYPADIIGQVTVANTVLAPNLKGVKKEATTISNDRVWWVVEVSIRNKEYPLPVSALPNSSTKVTSNVVWVIIYNDKTWSGTKFKPSQDEISPGQSGNLWLSFESKADFNPADLQICYQGQEPFSYGKLIAGDKVAVYDWTLKKATTKVAETPQETNVATVERIWVSAVWIGGGSLYVELKPKSSALANKVYTVELYEKGKLRETAKVSWNQPEINVLKMKPVKFSATRAESEAYAMEKDLSNIFSVKVYE